MVFDLVDPNAFFRYVTYFPLIKYNVRTFYSNLHKKYNSAGVVYAHRKQMVIDKIDLAKPFIHLQLDVEYLSSLLQYASRREKERPDNYDWYPVFKDIEFIRFSLMRTPFNSGFDMFHASDGKVNFFPKKYNRISHKIPKSNILEIPREFDDIIWPFWNIPFNFVDSYFCNSKKSNIKESFFNVYVEQTPFWFFKLGFNEFFFFFNNNMNMTGFWSSILNSNDISFEYIHLIANTKTFHKSVYSGQFDKIKYDPKLAASYMKKKKSTDLISDYKFWELCLSRHFDFKDIQIMGWTQFVSDLTFYMPVFSSLFFKDLNDFKKIRNDSFFDVSFYFSYDNYEEVVCQWIVDSVFFFKVLHHCYYNNLNFPEMNNLLSHYNFIFSRQKLNNSMHLYGSDIIPNTGVEAQNKMDVISDLFGASNFYEPIQKNLIGIYLRDNNLDKILFKFFFNIEKILQWSPFDSYHKFDETSYIGHNEVLKMLLTNQNFKASNKIKTLLEKNEKYNLDSLLSFNESEWDCEFYGVYFSDIFLIFLLFLFLNIFEDLDWFLFYSYIIPKNFDINPSVNTLFTTYFETYFMGFSSHSFFSEIFNAFTVVYFYFLNENLNPIWNDVEGLSRFFFFGSDDSFYGQIFWNVFDWWHDEYFHIEDDEFSHITETLYKEDEENNEPYHDLYFGVEDSGYVYEKFSDWYKPKRGHSWYVLKRNLYLFRWNRQVGYIGGYKSKYNNFPWVLKAMSVLHEDEFYDDYQYKTVPLFFEYGDFDWFFLNKIYDVSNWNYQAVLPLSTFYFFFDDFFIDTLMIFLHLDLILLIILDELLGMCIIFVIFKLLLIVIIESYLYKILYLIF